MRFLQAQLMLILLMKLNLFLSDTAITTNTGLYEIDVHTVVNTSLRFE